MQVQKIYRQGAFETFYDMPLEINWAVTDMCNYRCSYCFGQKPLDARRFSSLEQMQSVIIRAAALNRPSYSITFTGGEPTTHPHFFELIAYADEVFKERLNNILIISNGSRQGKLYDRIASVAQKIRINMNISIHTDHADLEHIVFLVEHLSQQIQINFSLMYNPGKLDFVKQIHTQLLGMRKKYPFHLNIMTLREPPAFAVPDRRYTQEHFDWQHTANAIFQKTATESGIFPAWRGNYPKTNFWDTEQEGKRTILKGGDRNKYFQNGMLGFKGMYCALGTRILAVSPDGFCKGAQCKVATAVSKSNIFEETPYEDENFIRIVQCTEESCGCSTNTPIPKFADKEEAESFVRIFRMKQKRMMQEYKERQSVVMCAPAPELALPCTPAPQTVTCTPSVQPVLCPVPPAILAKPGCLDIEAAFDADYYLKNNPDVAQSVLSPLEHFLRHGFKENRNPTPWFDIQFYIASYPDVAHSGMNTFLHYLRHGIQEGRKTQKS